MEKYKGIPVFMDGKTYIIPSLSVAQFEEHYEVLSSSQPEGSSAVEFMKQRMPIIHAAVSRNYPDVTLEQLRQMVDLGTFRTIIAAIQAASGMKEVTPGEALPVEA